VLTQIRQVVTKLGAARTEEVVRMLRQGQAKWASAKAGALPGSRV